MAQDDQQQQVRIIPINQPQKLSIFESEKAGIDVQVATAHAYPRKLSTCVDNAITTVQLSQEIAESCMYAVPRGDKSIKGPSVHLAKIMAQTWGNMRIANKVVDIDLKHVTSQAMCWDLESNLAIQTEVKRLIIGREGRFNDDMITVTGNAANAISLRNAVFAVIPEGFVDRIYKAAIERITGKLSSKNALITKRTEIITRFKEAYSVTEKEILSVLNKQSIDNITIEDIAFLIAIGTALRDGDTTVDEAFRKKKTGERNPEMAKLDRIIALIKDAKTIEQLESLKKDVQKFNSPELNQILDDKYAEVIKK
jgi:hypothetical protein